MSNQIKGTVVVFGAGIAGLTAAHEFARLGYRVSVYEANKDAGGFFRSARLPQDSGMPSEYSWHGIAPWYHNVFDLMKQIPFDDTDSMYNKALSRPIDFGLAPDKGEAAFDDTFLVNAKGMFHMSWIDVIKWGWLMLKTWTSNRRTFEYYSTINAAKAWGDVLRNRSATMWRSSFGPWIGSDWTQVSLHQAGHFFRKQLISKPTYYHKADAEGPSWKHGARSGWLLLKGPSNEYWFERWVTYLKTLGVDFHWNTSLYALDFDGNLITAAHSNSGDTITADIYVLATNPFAAAEIIARTPELEKLDQLKLFKPLIQDGPHTQVSLRIAFPEKILWPRRRAAVVIADSEYDLTMFAQEQAWDDNVSLGEGIASLWTVTACVATVPGRVYGLPLIHCTKEQFIAEVKKQLFDCEALDLLIKEANDGRSIRSFPILKVDVWHEWEFSSDGITYHQPKWVNTTHTQQYMPTQETPVKNLLLAGAHTKTEVDVWSIEAAVESGRRAAKVIEPNVTVVPQYMPVWLRIVSGIDDVLYALRMPHVIDIALAILVFAFVVWVARAMFL